MPINIHGNEYITVAERVQAFHKEAKKGVSINTEVLYQNPVVIKATVVTDKGTFTGISAANPLKPIEKISPYEVAESSAVGRALGFAGYGIISGIATAEEMVKASNEEKSPGKEIPQHYCDYHKCEMRLNKNGKEYHMNAERTEFCNGSGFPSEKKGKVTIDRSEEEYLGALTK